jgi:hypothetical protein
VIPRADFAAACTPSARRLRLKDAVARLALALANEECIPTLVELQALAELCEAQYLPAEAARVRRWIAGASP